MNTSSRTILLIHGLWVTPRSWEHCPLLLIGGEKDVIMPASLNRKNFRKYSGSSAITEYKEFAGCSHFIIGEKGWEEVADYALDWAESKISESAEKVALPVVKASASPVNQALVAA